MSLSPSNGQKRTIYVQANELKKNFESKLGKIFQREIIKIIYALISDIANQFSTT